MLNAAGCGGPTSLGEDDDARGAVDALWTAVTARRPELLQSAADRLHQLRADGRLPSAAGDELDAIIATARAEKWEPAAHALKAFIQGQSRRR